MAIGSSLGITLPTQGGNTGTWGTDLNAELTKIIDAVEAQVPITAIDFSTNLDALGFGITSLSKLAFDNQTATADLNAVYFKLGEAYIRDGANNEIQVTASGSLNSASSGGLGDSGGDYGTNGITFDWDGTLYNALDGATSYADVRMANLRLSDTDTNYLTVATPALASNYTMTLPAAVPATAGTLLQSNTSGTLTFANTGLDDITLTANQHVTISGTGLYKHGARVLGLPACLARGGGSTTVTLSAAGFFATVGTATGQLQIPLVLPVGSRITQWDFYGYKATATSTSFDLNYQENSGSAVDGITSLGSSTTTGEATHTDTTSVTLVTGRAYTVSITVPSDSTTDRFNLLKITYDLP